MSEIKTIQDISTESIILGLIFRKPTILNEYIELITPDYDFSESGIRFLYNLLIDTYLNHDSINETSINIQVSKMSESDQALYKNMGGYKLYQRLATISESSTDFKKHYDQLKAFNILRHLHDKGFAVEKNLDKLKGRSADEILKAYEFQLIKAGSYIKGIGDSVRLGDDILSVYQSYKQSPDIGISLPFPIVDSLIRGWRTSKLNALAMHSGCGKSRIMVFILAFTSIINQTPVLFCVNEQDKAEIDLMLLTCIANNVFSKKYGGILINETEISLGQCTGDKDKMVVDAANFIAERSKIQFLELQDWSFDSIKMILKKHKLRGVRHVVIDTFKSMRGLDSSMPDWMQFSHTAEQLKKIIGSEKKGGLDMALWLTMQMTDESLVLKTMNSSAIANSKQIKHHLDYLQMFRRLDSKDKEKIKVKIEMPNNPFNGQIQELDAYKTYYLSFIDKNRSGKDKSYLIYELDNGTMKWNELGYAVFNHAA